jgi:hypothetical protein
MKINLNKLWIVAITLGWLFDFLFWQQVHGINFAVFSTFCIIGALYFLLSEGFRPHRASLLLVVPIGFFAIVTFVRAEPLTTFLAYTFTLFLMAILATTYLGGRWFQYTISDYVTKIFSLLGSIISYPFTLSIDICRARIKAGITPIKSHFWSVLRGITIALPIVAMFTYLLASADLVFSQKLFEFMNIFNAKNFSEYLWRLTYILAIGYGLAGVILHAATLSTDEKLIGEDKPLLQPLLGFIESVIVLGSVVTLFTLFVVIQFQYLFGGETNINVVGYTYSEYARKGFGELVAVAFFALLMWLTLSTITKRESELLRRIFSGLGVALMVLVLVILVSAYQRIALYEVVYGFSRLRIYTHVFLVWLALLLIATIVLEILRRERAFALAALLMASGFAISLPILNVDAFIVQQNLQRELLATAANNVELDTRYFIHLSADAIPALVSMLQTPSLPEVAKEKLGIALACIRYRHEMNKRHYSWQSFHFAEVNTTRYLDMIKSELDDKFIVIEHGNVVLTNTKEISCDSSND